MHEAPYLRCSDADRDRAAAVLREGLADGRIAMGELDDRLDRVYRARTYGELTSVMGDLPAWGATSGTAYPAASPAPPMGRPLPARAGRRGGLRRAAIVTVMIWVLFLSMASRAAAQTADVLPMLFLVTIWVFVLTMGIGRRRRRDRGQRHLPPPR